jgi:hypothetical protein
MTHRSDESICKLARRKLFKPCPLVEGGDKTILTIPLFNYNMMLNKQTSSHSCSIEFFIYKDNSTIAASRT